ERTPITIGSTFILNQSSDENRLWWNALPDGNGALSIQGYGISGGTDHPEEAYELLEFMTQHMSFLSNLPGEIYSRQSLNQSLANELFFPQQTSQAPTTIEQIVDNANPTSYQRFYRYIPHAIARMRTTN